MTRIVHFHSTSPNGSSNTEVLHPEHHRVNKNFVTGLISTITEENGSKIEDRKRKKELAQLISVVLENSTIMPFRWAANKYMCFFCCCTFVDSVQLRGHTLNEHKDAKLRNVLRSLMGSCRIKLDTADINCKRCPNRFEQLEKFLDHAADTHNLEFNKEISKSIFTFNLSDEGMCCHECGKEFQFFGPLLKHVHSLHNKYQSYLCEICGQGFVGRANVHSHIKNVHCDYVDSRKCFKCDKTFKSHSALREHEAKVHRTELLKCPKCPEVLGSKYLKKRHLALVHDVKKLQFHCDQCDKIYTMKSRLVQHKLRIHLKEKNVSCDICGYKVFNQDLLKRHMVKHDDSRPFKCEFCHKSFQRKRTLAVHTRIHTNDRRYVCKECGQAFVQTTSLKLHMRVHHGGKDHYTERLGTALE